MKNKILNYEKFFESKNYSKLYHILNIKKLEYIFETNSMKSYRAGGGYISFTRDKMMNNYLGGGPMTYIKLEIDGEKLSNDYKIKPFSYKSNNGYLIEHEERVKSPIKNVFKYITKIIINKQVLNVGAKSMRDDDMPFDLFTTVGVNSKYPNIVSVIKYIKENSPVDIYVQDKTIIKKDDKFIDSLLNYDLYKVKFKWDVWYRGNFPHKKIKFATKDTFVDSDNIKHEDVALGYKYPFSLNIKDIKPNESDHNKIKIIDGVKCIPYYMKFRILKTGYYLENIYPVNNNLL